VKKSLSDHEQTPGLPSPRELQRVTLQEVRRRVTDLADRIGVSGNDLPTFGYSEDFGRPHLEVNERGIHYVVVERGSELTRVTSHDAEEILWHVFQSVTFSLACDYELAHRDERKDCRRLIFAHQQQLLEVLSPEWGRRQALYHQATLDEYPFDDDSSARVELSVKLCNSGYSKDEAWQQACERYPLPKGGEGSDA
jgi:hypothetical protein